LVVLVTGAEGRQRKGVDGYSLEFGATQKANPSYGGTTPEEVAAFRTAVVRRLRDTQRFPTVSDDAAGTRPDDVLVEVTLIVEQRVTRKARALGPVASTTLGMSPILGLVAQAPAVAEAAVFVSEVGTRHILGRTLVKGQTSQAGVAAGTTEDALDKVAEAVCTYLTGRR
jgi:hypothetical protein